MNGAGPRRDIRPARGTVVAPPLPRDAAWLNTERPLALRDLRGKVVLLDFWTYCCINCLHVAAELATLEARYRRELVVIGVHAPKFPGERATEGVRQAVLRCGIRHPVVNDSALELWRSYGVRAWPTLVLIDPQGRIVGRLSGEGVHDALDRAIAGLIQTFDAEGKIDRRPLDLRAETRAPTPLAFPGKVWADEGAGRLFIADSNHHRVVVTDLAGAAQGVIGSGRPGLRDGPFPQAQFHHPQGMTAAGSRLYVCDTGNHAVRLADLDTGTVTTIAGTGRQTRTPNLSGPAAQTDLNSPWDVALHGDCLYVAMAGAHQIWRLDLSSHWVGPFAGSGHEARIDGAAPQAALAQPSGLASDGTRLYVADSESSSIRSLDLGGQGQVETVAGGDLFDFGDNDGAGLAARFQHPMGVAWQNGALYVADTYNNKIRRISLADRLCRVFAGTGETGSRDGRDAAFYEPSGLSAAGRSLYVADTNNHCIRIVDLQTGLTRTLRVCGLAG